MTSPKRGIGHWLSEQARLPRWIVLGMFLITSFNAIIFLAVVSAFWRPDTLPVPITGDVAIGMHLQLFEAFLAALAIGLAVFGFAGYAAIRESAERRAEDTAREYMQRHSKATSEDPVSASDQPDLRGLDTDINPGDREPEERI